MDCPHCRSQLADDARFCGACGKVIATTESDPRMPIVDPYLAMVGREIVGRYRIVAKLGEGGMGAVFRAEQISLKRAVAVKLLRPEIAASPQLLRRFNAEAEVVAKLSHPNTVGIYDFGQDTDGSLFIAMEYIDGRSLRSVLQAEAPLALGRTLAIARQITESLADAHAHAIVHRDLKPDNVMLQDRGKNRDIVRVLDFGIAKLRDETRATALAMTQAGDLLGTPQYMAPEQIKGEPIDGRTDIYALGCMLYEMITARMPFEAPTVMAILSKHLIEQPIPPSQRRPDLMLPPTIDQLVLGAMAKDPASRPATMDAFGEQIAAVVAAIPLDTLRSISVAQPVVSASQPAVTPPAPSADQPRAALGYAIAPTVAIAPAVTAPGSPQPAAITLPQVVKPTPPPEPRDRTTLFVLIAIGVLCVGGFIVWKNTSEPDLSHFSLRRHDAGTPDPWEKPVTVDNAKLPPGALLRPQPGFESIERDNVKMLVDQKRGVTIMLFPIEPSNADAETLARQYAKTMKLDFVKVTKIHSHGAERDLGTFTGTNPRGLFAEVVVAYLEPTYRVGLAVAAPAPLAATQQFQQWLDTFVERDVVLP